MLSGARAWVVQRNSISGKIDNVIPPPSPLLIRPAHASTIPSYNAPSASVPPPLPSPFTLASSNSRMARIDDRSCWNRRLDGSATLPSTRWVRGCPPAAINGFLHAPFPCLRPSILSCVACRWGKGRSGEGVALGLEHGAQPLTPGTRKQLPRQWELKGRTSMHAFNMGSTKMTLVVPISLGVGSPHALPTTRRNRTQSAIPRRQRQRGRMSG